MDLKIVKTIYLITFYIFPIFCEQNALKTSSYKLKSNSKYQLDCGIKISSLCSTPNQSQFDSKFEPQSNTKIILTIILREKDWKKLSDVRQNIILDNINKVNEAPKDFVILRPSTFKEIERTDSSIGFVKKDCKLNDKFLKLEFSISCSKYNKSIAYWISKLLCKNPINRAVHKKTQFDFCWWSSERKNITEENTRLKRETENDDDYENYVYDDAEEDEITELPTTPAHAHRHHHGSSKFEELENNVTNILMTPENNFSHNNENNAKMILNHENNDTESNFDNDNVKKDLSKLELVISKTIENTEKYHYQKEIPLPKNNSEQNKNIDGKNLRDKDIISTEEVFGSSLITENSPISVKSTGSRIIYITTVRPTHFDFPILQNKSKLNSIRESYSTLNPHISTFINPSSENGGINYSITPTINVMNESTIPTIREAENNKYNSTRKSIQSGTESQNIDQSRTSAFTSETSSIDYQGMTTTLKLSSRIPENITIQPIKGNIIAGSEDNIDDLESYPTDRYDYIENSTSDINDYSTVTTASVVLTSYKSVVNPKPINNAPVIKTRLPKIRAVAGKFFIYKIPSETFVDEEDLDKLKLTFVDPDGQQLKPNYWVQFDEENKEIYGLPLENDVSRYTFKLIATDSGNENVTETVEIAVQQYKGYRGINHEIILGIKLNTNYSRSLNWQVQVLKAIADNISESSSLVVRDIRQGSEPSTASMVYYNETLPKDVCPSKYQMDNIIHSLSNDLNSSLGTNISITSVNYQLIGNCENILHHHITTATPLIPHKTKNYSPVPRNQVDRVNATVGHLLIFKVPSDTFYDPEDTTDLKLSLLTMERNELSTKHWLQFDSKNQEFYGIPKVSDYGSEEYLLVAEDRQGLTATDALVVVVNHAPKREFSVYFKAKLGIKYENFDAQMQRKFVERMAKVFNDATPIYIQIRSINQNLDDGQTIINFYNTTLHRQHNRCPEEEIDLVRSILFSTGGNLRDRVKNILGNEINLLNLQIVPMPIGSCHAGDHIGGNRDVIPYKAEDSNIASTFNDDYILTFVLPSIIILLIILFASLVACVLHRRRISGKMELGNEEERKSFRTKGIPVIFQDELDEKPDLGNKTPIILKDEKPPLLPPSYNSTNVDGENDCDEYVPPPAVLVGNREIRGKSPVTPSYRKPPPYVSP